MGPSRRHQLLAWAVPRLRSSSELVSGEAERAELIHVDLLLPLIPEARESRATTVELLR